MSYKSPVNIRLPRIPEVPDENFYPIFQATFNAIHILNANITEAVEILLPPTQGEEAAESFAPRLNTFWAPAADNVIQGRIVTMSGAQFTRGVAGYEITGGVRITDPFGVCVEDSEGGQARIAWPPFVLNVDMSSTSAGIGDTIHTDHTGGIFYIGGTVTGNYWPIAQIIDTNMLLFTPNMHT